MIDVIIVNYKTSEYLKDCLRSLAPICSKCLVKIYIQNNGASGDEDEFGIDDNSIHSSANSKNLGFSKAVNQALRKSTGKYVVLLNPDTHIINGFFESSIQFMESHPEVGILGPKILDGDGGIQNSARSFPTPLTTFFGRSSWISRKFPNNPITRRNLLNQRSKGDAPLEVDWVSGACMVVRRKAIEDVGPLDERFFMYWEDADWCRRMWNHGWRVVYFPGASIYHYAGKSSDQNLFQSTIEFHKSAYRLFSKYTSSSFGKPFAMMGLAVHLVFALLGKKLARR